MDQNHDGEWDETRRVPDVARSETGGGPLARAHDLSAEALAERSSALLDDLDRTGLGIGVSPEYLAELREALVAHLVPLLRLGSVSTVALHQRELLVARARGFVSDWTYATLRSWLECERQALAKRSEQDATRRDGEASLREREALEAALARYRQSREATLRAARQPA